MESARTNPKKGEKKEQIRRGKVGRKKGPRQGEKPRTPTPAIDALIGEEEQTGKKRKQRKKQGEGLQPSYPGPFCLLLRPVGIVR